MRVIVAPQEFKGSLSAAQAAEAIRDGTRAAAPDADIECIPLSDGGPGFLDAMLTAGGRRHEVRARDPLGRHITARVGLIEEGTTAVIESAEAAGLWRLAPDELDPRRASTAGVGD